MAQHMPLNDILVITHTRPGYARLALERLLATCDERCQLWLWHNGNDAETLDVATEFSRHPLVHRFHHSPDNKGQNTPLRWIMEHGAAPYVSKVDDDCLMPHGWLQTLRRAHADIADLGVIGCWRFPDDLFLPHVAAKKIKRLEGDHRLMLNSWVEGSGFVLKRTCVEREGIIPRTWSFPRYCVSLAAKGWVNGWYFPFLYQEHMDHPWSVHTMFKRDNDLARHAPVNARRWGVTTVDEYSDHFRQEAYRLQRAKPDARLYTGWRGTARRIQRRLLRAPGERDWTAPTPVDDMLDPIRATYRPGQRLYYASPWVNQRYRSDKPIIVVGGSERSGTTLLRAVIDSHPDVAMGPETWLFVYRPDVDLLSEEYGIARDELRAMCSRSSGLPEFIDRFSEWYCAATGKSRWGEKSPQNVLRLRYIWKHFPNARFVHIIRDGRDVVCSLRNHPRRIRIGDTYYPTNINRPVDECVETWATSVEAGVRHRGDSRYLEVRYEDLVADHEGLIRRIVEHCGLAWSNDLLRRQDIQAARPGVEIVNPEVRGPLYNRAVGRWQQDLSDADVAIIKRRAGDLLRSLGYA